MEEVGDSMLEILAAEDDGDELPNLEVITQTVEIYNNYTLMDMRDADLSLMF